MFRYRFPAGAVFPPHVTEKDRYGGQEVHLFVGQYHGTMADIRVSEVGRKRQRSRRLDVGRAGFHFGTAILGAACNKGQRRDESNKCATHGFAPVEWGGDSGWFAQLALEQGQD